MPNACTPLPDTPLVSVVLLNFNGRRFLDDCLNAVLADEYPLREILLIDNGSTDGSLAMAYNYQSEGVTIWPNRANLGFPAGCNRGIEIARGDIIVLLNIDTIVQSGWLQQLVTALQKDPQTVIAASTLLYFDGKTVQFQGGTIDPNGLTHHRGDGETWVHDNKEVTDIAYATGASVAIRRDWLQQSGGLDEGFPLYYEDVDLSVRAIQQGFRVVYQPHSVVWHYQTFGTVRRSWTYYFKYHRGRLRFVLKQFGPVYFLKQFLPAELRWFFRCDFHNQALPLLFAYLSQVPNALRFWTGRQFRKWHHAV